MFALNNIYYWQMLALIIELILVIGKYSPWFIYINSLLHLEVQENAINIGYVSYKKIQWKYKRYLNIMVS